MRKILAAMLMLAMVSSFAGPVHAKKPVTAEKKAAQKIEKKQLRKMQKAERKAKKAELKQMKQAESTVVVTPIPAEAAAKTE